MYPLVDSVPMYSIYQIQKVKRQDGRMEIIPSDTTVAFIADNMDAMSLSFPIS